MENIIRTQDVNAEYAIGATADNFAAIFEAMDDAYMQGRAADVRDVSERLLQALSSQNETVMVMDEPVIIAADDLVPSETVQLDKEKVLSFVTMYGSANSHTAILARTMNIPAVIGLGEALKEEYDGKVAIVDGVDGKVYIDPDEETMASMQKKQKKDQEQKELLNQLKGKENVTKSGQKVNVYANIGNLADVGAVLKNDAGGIGLFRSEFLYLESVFYHFPVIKSNEQLFNKSCQEQQKISRIGSCFRGSRGILQILFPYFCIFHTAPGTVICLSAHFFVCTDTNIISASLFQNRKVFGFSALVDTVLAPLMDLEAAYWI